MTLSIHEIYTDLRAADGESDRASIIRAAREELTKRQDNARKAPKPEAKHAWKKGAR